jgi:hypothetical protein
MGQIGFEGPSILSRGTRPIGRGDGRPIRLRGFASFNAFYSDGLGGPSITADGRPIDRSGYGGFFSYGVSGGRSNNRENLSVDYSGGMQVFNKRNNYYSGLFQSLGVNYSRALTNRWSMFSGVRAATSNWNMANLRSFSSPLNQNYFEAPYNPAEELFDNRIYTFGAGVGAAYRATSRLTFSMSGGSGAAIRNSRGLVSFYNFGTGGEVNYSLSNVSNIGASYTYGQVGYRHGFGDASAQTWMGMYGRRIFKEWFLGAGAGFFRAEMNRLGRVSIDPALAAIIGQSSTVERFYRVSQGVAANANLGRAFRRSNVNFFYSRGVNPGNGVMLTSEMENAGFGWSYTGLRRVNIGGGALHTRRKALMPINDNLIRWRSNNAFVGVSYRLTGFLHFNTNAAVMSAKITGPSYNRSRYVFSAGVAFSPGEVPLQLW